MTTEILDPLEGLSDQTAISPGALDLRTLYSKRGDLYYRNAAGVQIPITVGSSISGATGSITGLVAPAAVTFNAGTGVYAFTTDTNKGGKLAISDIQLFEFNNASAQAITLKSPAGVTAYTWTLPALAATQDVVIGVTAAGQLSAGAGVGSAAAPCITFATDLDTGLYRDSNNTMGISTGGTSRAMIDVNGLRLAVPQVGMEGGSASVPAFSFTANPNTGMYRTRTNTLGFTTGGTLRL